MEGFLLSTSIIAAFVAGMVALFAPCCITFLFPAYLGSVFKEREKVLAMTLVFGLGIFVVLMPAVLGVAFASKMLLRYHDVVYLLGAFVMIGAGIISLLGLKLPMPSWAYRQEKTRTDVVGGFTLGIFSGLTSACCAPVLIGVLAFAFLSPNFLGALLLGAVYVLGMVTPLLLMSLFFSYKMPGIQIWRKPLTVFSLSGREYPLLLGNLIAGAIFLGAGFITFVLTMTGKLSMTQADQFSKLIQNAGAFVNDQIGPNPLVNFGFLFALTAGLIFFLMKVKGGEKAR